LAEARMCGWLAVVVSMHDCFSQATSTSWRGGAELRLPCLPRVLEVDFYGDKCGGESDGGRAFIGGGIAGNGGRKRRRMRGKGTNATAWRWHNVDKRSRMFPAW
jgi:hypothetical protein